MKTVFLELKYMMIKLIPKHYMLILQEQDKF